MNHAVSSKQVTAAEAVSKIRSFSALAVGGAGGVQEPDLLLSALLERFRRDGEPRGLTEFHPIRTGEVEGRGTSIFGEPGLVARIIGGSYWPVGEPPLIREILEDRIAAYNFPIGILYALLEAVGSGRPGVVSTVGLGTFVDPEQDGGALNASAAKHPLVERILIDGQPHLFYKTTSIDTSFIRGTTADELGNITMEQEAALCGPLLLARAAKANGGRVIAQVKHIVPRGELDPRKVVVPAPLVDDVVVHEGQMQTTRSVFDPTLVGEARFLPETVPPVSDPALLVVLRRALLEVTDGDVVGIGFGAPGYLPGEAVRQGRFDRMTFTIEHGLIGGINGFSAGGSTFPVSHNPEAIVDAADQLAWYAGGGVDQVFLGIGEVDITGNVNVSRFGNRIPGCGGFIEMTDRTQKITFCGVMRGRQTRKIVKRVQHMTFNGKRAFERGTEVRYITEIGVFSLDPSGLILQEFAPGLDPEKDLPFDLGRRLSRTLTEMPSECFR